MRVVGYGGDRLETFIREADVAAVADDYVVEDADTHEVADFAEAVGRAVIDGTADPTALMTRFVAEGRSTPGPAQQNDAPPMAAK